MNTQRALGRYGEQLAERWLRQTGMTILDRNWHCVEGEIDIVARDADAVVVCEVKTRRPGPYGSPSAGVSPLKAARLHTLANRWLTERWLTRHHTPPTGGIRIDLVGITLPRRGAPRVEHVRGVA
ncbi:YraN family protein [Streptomyces sp. AJS327]|uniref:YraN family protein n=1 Tax=Streptomyces sp. AJS327 TaxID=2545265 RepID=UPI0015E01444|nr:YraN family protein [Streptomyces sp. AJS327]MBA0051821.1 YraN family protein [Streptomyces sp. AJS327]